MLVWWFGGWCAEVRVELEWSVCPVPYRPVPYRPVLFRPCEKLVIESDSQSAHILVDYVLTDCVSTPYTTDAHCSTQLVTALELGHWKVQLVVIAKYWSDH